MSKESEEANPSLAPCYTLSDFDIWYKPCGNCGYDTRKASARSEPRCWKCGHGIYRDYSERALKQERKLK